MLFLIKGVVDKKRGAYSQNGGAYIISLIIMDRSILPVTNYTYRPNWCIQFRLSNLDIVKDTLIMVHGSRLKVQYYTTVRKVCRPAIP